MISKEARKRFAQLIHKNFIFRTLVGFAVCFPIVFTVAVLGHTTKAYFTDRTSYFEYAAKTCQRSDGSQQVRAVEYVGVVLVGTNRFGIEFASCSIFYKALPVSFHDRLFCSADGKEYSLVSWQDEEVEQAKVGTDFQRKRWVYAQNFYMDKSCYIDSLVTIHDGWVKKNQTIISEEFIPSQTPPKVR